MLATHEAQVIPVIRIKHFCVFSFFKAPPEVLAEAGRDLRLWVMTEGRIEFWKCEDVLLCCRLDLTMTSLRTESLKEINKS